MFIEISQNSQELTGRHLWQSLFFNKVDFFNEDFSFNKGNIYLCLILTFSQILNPNLGGRWVLLPPPGWFSLNNSEIVKAVTLAFYRGLSQIWFS